MGKITVAEVCAVLFAAASAAAFLTDTEESDPAELDEANSLPEEEFIEVTLGHETLDASVPTKKGVEKKKEPQTRVAEKRPTPVKGVFERNVLPGDCYDPNRLNPTTGQWELDEDSQGRIRRHRTDCKSVANKHALTPIAVDPNGNLVSSEAGLRCDPVIRTLLRAKEKGATTFPPELKNFRFSETMTKAWKAKNVAQARIMMGIDAKMIEKSKRLMSRRRNPDPLNCAMRLHDGLDFFAPEGTPVMAAYSGKIIEIGYTPANGNYIKLDADPGGEKMVFLYIHLKGTLPGLTEGQHVDRGDVIGYAGNLGRSVGSHLHLEVSMKADLTKDQPFGDCKVLKVVRAHKVGVVTTIDEAVIEPSCIIWDYRLQSHPVASL